MAALVIGFVPPSQLGRANPVEYAALVLGGILALGILPPLLMDRLRKPGWKAGGTHQPVRSDPGTGLSGGPG